MTDTSKRGARFLRETVSYLIVGVISTLISFALQFLFTTVLLWNYTGSSILSFALACPVSFFLNRKFTFHAEQLPLVKTAIRFCMIVIPCFVLSYFVLKPGVNLVFNQINLNWPEQYITYAKQIVANGVYIVINYLGQKFFTFYKKSDADTDSIAREAQTEEAANK